MRHQRFAYLPKRNPAVTVQQIRLVLIHQILDPLVPLGMPTRVIAVPTRIARFRRPVIQFLVCGIISVVGNSLIGPLGIRTATLLEPRKAGPQVLGDAKPKTLRSRCLRPVAHHIALRTHLHRIPLVIAGIPKIEIIVVHSHAHEVLGARRLIQLHQGGRIPLIRVP